MTESTCLQLNGRYDKKKHGKALGQMSETLMAQVYPNKLSAYVTLLRPTQWVKNGFVLTPLLFSGEFAHASACLKAVLTFISFCFMSSAVYAFNDVCDVREDRQHPVKKSRPVASGAITARMAVFFGAILVALSLILAWQIATYVAIITLLYGSTHVAYSLGLKRVAILDVMVIAAGFVLRILAGSVAIPVTPSHWLIICTIMISLFLGFTKRRAELLNVGDDTPNARAVLKDYSAAFLDQVIAMVTGATIVCYVLYTVDPRTVDMFGTRAMLLTVPSVMYGLFRYIYLIYHLKQGEDPTSTLIHDMPTLMNLVIWIALSILVVSYGEGFELL
jgi:4-hydroxybenzoate polyprenyltransferase